MKKYFATFSLLILFIASTLPASAQMAKTVNWRLSIKMTDKTEGVATLKAHIEPGWHLYSTTLPKGGPNPTVMDFSESKGIKWVGQQTVTPAPTTGYDQLFSMKLAWWTDTVTWRRKFKVTDADNAIIKCTIKYNTCNNQTCSMPVTETLSRKIAK